MTTDKHISELQGIAHDYAREAYTDLGAKIDRDGFGVNFSDTATLTGMTLQTMLTLHLLALMAINPMLARHTRKIFIEQLEASKEWL